MLRKGLGSLPPFLSFSHSFFLSLSLQSYLFHSFIHSFSLSTIFSFFLSFFHYFSLSFFLSFFLSLSTFFSLFLCLPHYFLSLSLHSSLPPTPLWSTKKYRLVIIALILHQGRKQSAIIAWRVPSHILKHFLVIEFLICVLIKKKEKRLEQYVRCLCIHACMHTGKSVPLFHARHDQMKNRESQSAGHR